MEQPFKNTYEQMKKDVRVEAANLKPHFGKLASRAKELGALIGKVLILYVYVCMYVCTHMHMETELKSLVP